MADTNYHINYSLEDIQRYLSGGMTAKEMHELERAALTDAFLADAIEGYTSADFAQSQKHLNEIAAALQGEKEITKVIPLKQNKNYWWRVAASVVLLAGIGSFTFYLMNNGSSNSENKQAAIAQAKKKDSVVQENSNANIVAADSALPLIAQNQSREKINKSEAEIKLDLVSASPAEATTGAEQNFAPVNKFSDSGAVTIGGNNNDAEYKESKEPSAIPAAALQKNAEADSAYLGISGKVAGIAAKSLFYNNANTFSGRVFDNNNKPLPGAVINAANKIVTATDANGNFTLSAGDSILNVYVSSVGFQQLNAQLCTGFSNNLYVIQDKQSLSEVVVTGLGAKRKATDKRESKSDSAYPQGGWQNFSNYVVISLSDDDDSAETYTSASGNVELEFSIDDKGNPYNIRVTKPLNDSINNTAIDILKNGPRWVPARKTRKAKVIIPFN